jgi:hypothetical protein
VDGSGTGVSANAIKPWPTGMLTDDAKFTVRALAVSVDHESFHPTKLVVAVNPVNWLKSPEKRHPVPEARPDTSMDGSRNPT